MNQKQQARARTGKKAKEVVVAVLQFRFEERGSKTAEEQAWYVLRSVSTQIDSHSMRAAAVGEGEAGKAARATFLEFRLDSQPDAKINIGQKPWGLGRKGPMPSQPTAAG